MITGCLQQKSGFYYAVLYLKVNGRRRCKWVPMRLPVEGTSARKAQKAFDEIRLQYEREEEERLEREAKAKELAENTHPDALLPFTEYMEKWLQSTRSSLATATYQSYSNMIKARIRPYFAPLGLQLREVTPQHIENFYQSIVVLLKITYSCGFAYVSNSLIVAGPIPFIDFKNTSQRFSIGFVLYNNSANCFLSMEKSLSAIILSTTYFLLPQISIDHSLLMYSKNASSVIAKSLSLVNDW